MNFNTKIIYSECQIASAKEFSVGALIEESIQRKIKYCFLSWEQLKLELPDEKWTQNETQSGYDSEKQLLGGGETSALSPTVALLSKCISLRPLLKCVMYLPVTLSWLKPRFPMSPMLPAPAVNASPLWYKMKIQTIKSVKCVLANILEFSCGL